MSVIFRFDYSALPDDAAIDAENVFAELRGLERRAVQKAAALEHKLISIRERLDHGLFVKWVESVFGSKSSAYRYINLAEHLADELPTVGYLPLKVAYKLAAPMA